MTDPIVRLDRLLLCPSTDFTGVSMLGDLGFLRNRSRLGLHKLQPRWRNADPAPFGGKRVNANSNFQAQGSCQSRPSTSTLMAGACKAVRSP
jgi:hypothetical protein